MGVVAFILGMLFTLIGSGKAQQATTVIPPMPQYKPSMLFALGEDYVREMLESRPVSIYEITGEDDPCICDACCHAEAVREYADEFTALFNSYTYKLAKNGRSMINGKFVAKGK